MFPLIRHCRFVVPSMGWPRFLSLQHIAQDRIIFVWIWMYFCLEAMLQKWKCVSSSWGLRCSILGPWLHSCQRRNYDWNHRCSSPPEYFCSTDCTTQHSHATLSRLKPHGHKQGQRQMSIYRLQASVRFFTLLRNLRFALFRKGVGPRIDKYPKLELNWSVMCIVFESWRGVGGAWPHNFCKSELVDLHIYREFVKGQGRRAAFENLWIL